MPRISNCLLLAANNPPLPSTSGSFQGNSVKEQYGDSKTHDYPLEIYVKGDILRNSHSVFKYEQHEDFRNISASLKTI